MSATAKLVIRVPSSWRERLATLASEEGYPSVSELVREHLRHRLSVTTKRRGTWRDAHGGGGTPET